MDEEPKEAPENTGALKKIAGAIGGTIMIVYITMQVLGGFINSAEDIGSVITNQGASGNDQCVGLADWQVEMAERIRQARAVMDEPESLRNPKPSDYLKVSVTMEAMATEQRNSAPPRAAVQLNKLFVDQLTAASKMYGDTARSNYGDAAQSQEEFTRLHDQTVAEAKAVPD
jgi:hypothetical protein